MSIQGILLERAGAKLTSEPRGLSLYTGRRGLLGKCKAGSIVTDLQKLSPPGHCNSISPNVIGHMDTIDIFDQPLQWSTDTIVLEGPVGHPPFGWWAKRDTSTIKQIPPFRLHMFVPLPKLCSFFCVSRHLALNLLSSGFLGNPACFQIGLLLARSLSHDRSILVLFVFCSVHKFPIKCFQSWSNSNLPFHLFPSPRAPLLDTLPLPTAGLQSLLTIFRRHKLPTLFCYSKSRPPLILWSWKSSDTRGPQFNDPALWPTDGGQPFVLSTDPWVVESKPMFYWTRRSLTISNF